MQNWYIVYNGREVGPMSKEQLLSYDINPNSMVWCKGMPQWVPAYTIPELMDLIKKSVPRPHYYQQPTTQATSEKSHVVAGILAIIFGGLGIYYFYIGKTNAGIFTILLALFTCGIWSIIPFIQGIMMLIMSQQQFENKYVNTPSTFPIF